MSKVKLTRVEALFYSPLLQFQISDCEALNRQLLEETDAMRARSSGVTRAIRKAGNPTPISSVAPSPDAPRCAITSWKRFLRRPSVCRRISTSNRTSCRWRAGSTSTRPALSTLRTLTPVSHCPAHIMSAFRPILSALRPTSTAASSSSSIRASTRRPPRSRAPPASIPGSSVKPKAGLLMIFPSYLRHWVYPNEEESERVSIAFNIRYLKHASKRPPQPARVRERTRIADRGVRFR